MTPPVTTVTQRAASAEHLTDQDYRDIYSEIRARMTLRAFIALINSRYSPGWWSKYENDQGRLTRDARNELRRAVSLPELPPTVADAVAQVDPDAVVYQVGQAPADRVVLVGHDVAEPLTMRINGHLETGAATVAPDTVAPVPESHVTPVTRPQRHRTPSRAIRVSPAAFDRLSARRRASGLTWDAFLSDLLGA